MAQICFLGTSGSVASARRDNTAFLVTAGGAQVLIDCPGSPVQKLQRLGFDFREISTVFLTHGHPDHTYGLPSLLQSQYKQGNRLRVFGHPRTLSLVKKLRRLYGLNDTAKYPALEFKPLTAGGKEFQAVPGLCVRPFPVSHLDGSLGYRFTLLKTGATVCFSGDTAYAPHLITAACAADFLIHDCFCPDRIFRRYPRLYSLHTSALQLGRIAGAARVKNLIPVHFASEVSYSARELIDEIRKSYRGRILLPSDGEKLGIAGPGQTKERRERRAGYGR